MARVTGMQITQNLTNFINKLLRFKNYSAAALNI